MSLLHKHLQGSQVMSSLLDRMPKLTAAECARIVCICDEQTHTDNMNCTQNYSQSSHRQHLIMVGVVHK